MNGSKESMRRVSTGLLVLVACAVVLGFSAASYGTQLVLFYEDGCPHCARIESFLERITPDYPRLEIVRHEIHDPDAHDLLDRLLSAYGAKLGSVPIIFIGDVAMVADTFYSP
ncbi:hypothetical protein J7J63_05390, partial [Candidatus Bipolaricaulota bacterium]|nr:hypothetical protein [Candidatus Bipolaricaulota bacterium]